MSVSTSRLGRAYRGGRRRVRAATDRAHQYTLLLITLLAPLVASATNHDRLSARHYLRGKMEARTATAGQASTVIQGVVIVVVASIGVVIVDNIDTSLGNASNDNLNQSQNNLLTGFGNMIDLIEPLLIVLIAVIVIAVVQRINS